MNLFRPISFVTVLIVAAALASSALARIPEQGQSTRPELKTLEIRGQALNVQCESPTLSREAFRALCGKVGAQHQPTRAELQALELRGQALNHLCDGGFVLSEAGYRAVCGGSRLGVRPLGPPDPRMVS